MHRLLMALILFTGSAVAAGVAGEWSGTGVVNKVTQHFYFIFLQDGVTLNGSGGPDPSSQDVIQNGKVDGDKISFDISLNGDSTTLHFELSVDGAGLKGTVQLKSKHETFSGALALRRPNSPGKK
jgi:hypothetical protein